MIVQGEPEAEADSEADEDMQPVKAATEAMAEARSVEDEAVAEVGSMAVEARGEVTAVKRAAAVLKQESALQRHLTSNQNFSAQQKARTRRSTGPKMTAGTLIQLLATLSLMISDS